MGKSFEARNDWCQTLEMPIRLADLRRIGGADCSTDSRMAMGLTGRPLCFTRNDKEYVKHCQHKNTVPSPFLRTCGRKIVPNTAIFTNFTNLKPGESRKNNSLSALRKTTFHQLYTNLTLTFHCLQKNKHYGGLDDEPSVFSLRNV